MQNPKIKRKFVKRWRYLTFSSSFSLQVLDYTQYYLDLEAANTKGEPQWLPEYNLTTYYYGLADVSAVALHNLADRFTNPEDVYFAK